MKVLRILDRAFERLLLTSASVGVVLILMIAVLIAIQVVGRLAFNHSIRGVFDLSVYALVAFPFLTMAYLEDKGKHISVDVITARLHPRTKVWLRIATSVIGLSYPPIFAWKAYQLAADLFNMGQKTEAILPIPKGVFISIMVGGLLLLALQIVRGLVKDIRSLGNGAVPRYTTTPGPANNPALYISLLFAGVVAGLLLFMNEQYALGLVFMLFLFLFAGMSVFFTLGLVGIVGLYFFIGERTLVQIPQIAYQTLYSFPLTCLPLFIVAGLVMERSKTIEGVFRFFELLVGNYASALMVVTILVGLVFCATSGSSAGTTAVVSTLALPILFKRGYAKGISCGLVGAATVGTLIPPSIGYVIYAILTDVSVGKLFMAAMGPGLLLFVFYIIYVLAMDKFAKKSLFEGGIIPTVSKERVTWKARFVAFRGAIWGLLAPVVVLGGIYAGFFTPTEAAGALALYAIVVSLLVVRSLNWRGVLKASVESAEISGMVLAILIAAFGLAMVITQMQLAPALVAWAQGMGFGKLEVLVLIFVVLTILGMFIDAASLKVITLPTFFPLAMAVGVDPLWFGVFYQINMEIGMLTPPVGMNLFIMQGVTGIPMTTIVKGTMPFLIIMILIQVIMYFWPELATWFPSTMK